MTCYMYQRQHKHKEKIKKSHHRNGNSNSPLKYLFFVGKTLTKYNLKNFLLKKKIKNSRKFTFTFSFKRQSACAGKINNFLKW